MKLGVWLSILPNLELCSIHYARVNLCAKKFSRKILWACNS